jgi:hypothetical protein
MWAIAVFTLLCALPMSAQNYPSGSMPPVHQGQGGMNHRGQEPCWKQAGISQSAMQQHKAIEERSHQQIQSVCSETNLTPQQRQEKIHTIEEQARAESERIVSPQQMSALKSCRSSRGETGHMGGMGGGHQGGPCGQMPGNMGGKMPPTTPPQTHP